MKVLFDTNVLISAFATDGLCSRLVRRALLRHSVCTSEFVLAELEKRLVGKIGLSAAESAFTIRILRRRCVVTHEQKLPTPVCRDSDDDHVLAAAAAAAVDFIVTGDKDLLTLRAYEGIPILSPSDFARLEDTLGTEG